MLHKLRERVQSEKGFTLIELLVVILIIGILAAIALPAFLGQKTKAQDASAKSDARNMVSQLESYAVDHDSYKNFTVATDAPGLDASKVAVPAATLTDKGYVITATSDSNNTFTITKADTGVITRTCATHGQGGCHSAADTSGNWW